MKKSLFFIAVAALLCTEVNAQDLACPYNPDNSFQTSLSEQPQPNISTAGEMAGNTKLTINFSKHENVHLYRWHHT